MPLWTETEAARALLAEAAANPPPRRIATYLPSHFTALAADMAAQEVAAGRWSERWARVNDAAGKLARTMAAEANRDPAKGAQMLAEQDGLTAARRAA